MVTRAFVIVILSRYVHENQPNATATDCSVLEARAHAERSSTEMSSHPCVAVRTEINAGPHDFAAPRECTHMVEGGAAHGLLSYRGATRVWSACWKHF